VGFVLPKNVICARKIVKLKIQKRGPGKHKKRTKGLPAFLSLLFLHLANISSQTLPSDVGTRTSGVDLDGQAQFIEVAKEEVQLH